jgi:hypothetical protein
MLRALLVAGENHAAAALRSPARPARAIGWLPSRGRAPAPTGAAQADQAQHAAGHVGRMDHATVLFAMRLRGRGQVLISGGVGRPAY